MLRWSSRLTPAAAFSGEAFDVGKVVDVLTVDEALGGEASGVCPDADGGFADAEDAGGVAG